MKTTVRKFVVLVVFAMALTALSVAQEATYRVTATVPFDFYAGGQQLPAGTYQFEVNYDNHSVTLRNKASGRGYALLARPEDGEGVGEAVVEFDVIGNTHLLADLKTASAGVNFPERKAMTASAQAMGSVAIVATLR